MIRLSPDAEQQIDELVRHYEARERPEATINLSTAIARAGERIERAPEAGLPAPRPYPILARKGRRWIREGRYWFAYSVADPPTILAVYYETSDLVRRAT